MQPQAEMRSPMRPHPFRVLEIAEEIPGCMTVRVEPSGDGGDAAFAPGQFYMIYIFGHGEVPISVSGDPEKSGELTFTVMAVGSVTQALCAVKSGDVIGLRGPFGSAWPVDKVKGRDVIVVAGGLGLAPLRPSIYRMLHNRNDYGDITLLYGTRQPQSIVFPQELADWREDALIEVEVTVDTAGRDWPGKVGVVTELLKGRNVDPAKTSALICGPEIMMRFSAYALLDIGVAAENIHVSMERNMKCAVRMCGRCQYGPFFICADGPVFPFDCVERLFKIREV
ncbi:FAD/NAD(P)-binding protein [Emcibacter sp.]|uniref:FAD/NAD(P)-binding protein n=1 Tax=Emcibacter sp. TaxID=1979954 RepID=UPI002AA7B387|nr:FAD/NAD(P)-binding protein [Emcibacter sp.]